MKKFFIVLTIIVALFVAWDIYTHYDYIDAFTGATPKALAAKVPGGISVKVTAFEGREYHFNSSSFRLLAKTRLRTREYKRDGTIIGSYSYEGVPLRVILEGVDPDKSVNAPFDRPTDIVVRVKSADGGVSCFSYGELTMATDSDPVILAYKRNEVLPDKEPEKYKGNKRKEEIENVALICPGDEDVSRYLEEVQEIEFIAPDTGRMAVPVMRKGMDYVSKTVVFAEKDRSVEVGADSLRIKEQSFAWFRIGHGRGIKRRELINVSGSRLSSVLRKYYPDLKKEDFILVTGGDGYRTVFSGYEVLEGRTGNSMIIVDEIEGKTPESGVLLGVMSDFYIDRCVRGVAHIARLKM